jgi:hypothetical protein
VCVIPFSFGSFVASGFACLTLFEGGGGGGGEGDIFLVLGGVILLVG